MSSVLPASYLAGNGISSTETVAQWQASVAQRWAAPPVRRFSVRERTMKTLTRTRSGRAAALAFCMRCPAHGCRHRSRLACMPAEDQRCARRWTLTSSCHFIRSLRSRLQMGRASGIVLVRNPEVQQNGFVASRSCSTDVQGGSRRTTSSLGSTPVATASAAVHRGCLTAASVQLSSSDDDSQPPRRGRQKARLCRARPRRPGGRA